MNLDGGAILICAHHSAARYQFQGYFAIELSGPTDGKLQIAPGIQELIGSEEHTITAHVDGLAKLERLGAFSFHHAVADDAIHRESTRRPALLIFVI
jgi:hypothetical protein